MESIVQDLLSKDIDDILSDARILDLTNIEIYQLINGIISRSSYTQRKVSISGDDFFKVVRALDHFDAPDIESYVDRIFESNAPPINYSSVEFRKRLMLLLVNTLVKKDKAQIEEANAKKAKGPDDTELK